MRIDGVHAVVTGGSLGIGLATARLLAERGAHVSLVAREPGRLEAAAASIGSTAATAVADVTDAGALEAALGALARDRGPCELLVASAGASHPGYFEQLELAVFRDQMELNFFGTLHAVRAVLPAMLARGSGGIVGISSTAGLVGVFGLAAYCPTKYAVRGLCDALRAEYGHLGIYVGCAFPPDTETPGFEAENRIKPAETAAVSGSIKPKSAAAVAAAIVRGIERDRATITADAGTAFLARSGGVGASIAHRQMARRVRGVRGP